MPDYQTFILRHAGNEGIEKCDEISNLGCTGTGMDFNLCKQYPEAHFVWFGITHFARFLNKLQYTFLSSTVSTGLSTSALVNQFYTPRESPSNLIMPVSIASGFAAAISAIYPPAAVAAGAGSIANGVLTQAGLEATK